MFSKEQGLQKVYIMHRVSKKNMNIYDYFSVIYCSFYLIIRLCYFQNGLFLSTVL